MAERSRAGGRNGGPEKISRWEWVSAVIGAILVFGSAGVMIHEAVMRPSTPPRVEITVDTIIDQPSGYLVRVRVRNLGSSTAAALEIEGELTGPDGSVHTSATSIDFVPERATRTAGLFFEHDPRRYPLRLRPIGYDEP